MALHAVNSPEMFYFGRSDETPYYTLEDYVGTWSYQSDGYQHSLTIGSDGRSTETIRYILSSSSSPGTIQVNSDGSARYYSNNEIPYSYTPGAVPEIVIVGEFQLSRTRGSIGTIIGTWAFATTTDSADITFNIDYTTSGTSNGHAFFGTWDEDGIHARMLQYDMTIDLAAVPNTLRLKSAEFERALARQ